MSRHFKRSEFACKCGCGFDTVDFELMAMLDNIREHFDRPVVITSGCRCESHNRAVKGSANSQHLHGRAADIQIRNVHPDLVYEMALQLNPGGLGSYKTFTHIDTRNGKSRW